MISYPGVILRLNRLPINKMCFMKTILRNSGLLLLVAIIFVSGEVHAQQKKSEKSLLWKVSGNGLKQPSYLFGTYHLLGDKFLAEVPEVQQPFAEAKGVVVELVLDSSRLMTIIMQKAVMTNNKLSTLLSPSDYHLVDSVFRALSGYELKTFDMFKPAQITVMFALFQAQKELGEELKKYTGTPLDIHFASVAKKNGVQVTPLETMDQQFDMLYNHFTVEEQAKQLVELVKQSDSAGKFSGDMTKLYFQKDVMGLGELLESYPTELGGNMEYMLKDRNLNWMKTLPELMKSGSQFIAVGAGHLPGENGLISLLQKQGYKVTPVTK